MCVLNPWKTSLGFSSVNKGVLLDKCASPLPAPSLLLSLPVFAFYSQLTIISIISFFFFFSTFMVSFFVYSWFQLSLFTYLLFSHLDLPPSLFTGLIQNPSLFCISAQPSPMWGFDCSSAYSNTEHHFMEKRSFQASLHSLAMMWFIVSSVWF